MQVLVLNTTYEPLAIVTLKRAMRLLTTRKAEVVEAGTNPLRSARDEIATPLVVRLLRYAHTRRMRRPQVSRALVLMRDGESCQYCGCRPSRAELTLDHIVPRAQGGQTSWENVVAACRDCNARKADRTPEQACMALRSTPRPLALPLARKLDLAARVTWSQYGFC
ncbi:MAG: HNH endonuclease [Chloroflexales bacterium]|nr:HNH endonuclease [Chloroflexales bacterium]